MRLACMAGIGAWSFIVFVGSSYQCLFPPTYSPDPPTEWARTDLVSLRPCLQRGVCTGRFSDRAPMGVLARRLFFRPTTLPDQMIVGVCAGR